MKFLKGMFDEESEKRGNEKGEVKEGIKKCV